MAITATIALSPTTATSGLTLVVATVTVSNSAAGGPSVNVLGIRPIIYNHGTQQTMPGYPDGANLSSPGVAPSGSTTFQFDFVPNVLRSAGAAGQEASPATMQLDVTAEVTAADGTVVIPSVAVLTVNPAPRS